jgi:hypothetical protein
LQIRIRPAPSRVRVLPGSIANRTHVGRPRGRSKHTDRVGKRVRGT